MDSLPEHWEVPEAPEFPAWAGYVWAAWRELDTERPIHSAGAAGGVPGRIPWRAVDAWACRHGVTGWNFDFLLRALAMMDGILIKHASKGA